MSEDAVLFEDENLIFINKPANFPVEQTITGNRANLHDKVVDFLWKRNSVLRNPPYVGIMHRLDRTTSGVIVFTKNRLVNKALSEIFQNHTLTKKYYAVVEKDETKPTFSKLEEGDCFTVQMFMGRTSGKSQQGKWGELSESKGGQFSKTDFKVVKTINIENKSCLLLECNLYTGRTHQIRVHLAKKNIPILGDTLYGGSSAKRIYLHSFYLNFTLNGITYDVKSPFKDIPTL
jgi:23S rRNA pseudouridine1911/1915/1917 synthase